MTPGVQTRETHHLTVYAEAPADVEEYRTPAGNGPMRPRGVRIEYDLTGRYGPHAEVRGDRLDRPRLRRAQAYWMVRRVRSEQLEAAPEWLRKVVADNDPGTCCERVTER